jgi:WXG100 family type VII secretion target
MIYERKTNMHFVPAGNNESFEVTPERLRDTAPTFHKASQDTVDLVHTLNASTQQLINDMSSELNKSPTALQHLCDRWHTSMNSLANALDKVGSNLETAGGSYTSTDQHVSNSFQKSDRGGFGRE